LISLKWQGNRPGLRRLTTGVVAVGVVAVVAAVVARLH